MLASWTFDTVYKRYRSFNAKNLRSVDQRVAKLLAIKLSACTLFSLYGQRVCKRLRPGFDCARGQIILKVWWPVTLQSFDLQTLSKFQEASRILRMVFALSKWPHLLHKMGFVDSLTHTTVITKLNTILSKLSNFKLHIQICNHKKKILIYNMKISTFYNRNR